MKRVMLSVLLALMVLPFSAEAHRFKPGDEIWAARKKLGVRYHHSGVYVGRNQIVHVSATIASGAKRLMKGGAPVRIIKTSLGSFAKGGAMKLGPTRLRWSRKIVVKRALSKVGRSFRYFLPTNNCQHFSSRVVSGRGRSPEISKYLRLWKKGAALAAKKAARAVVRKGKKAGRTIKKKAGKFGKSVKNKAKKTYKKVKKWF